MQNIQRIQVLLQPGISENGHIKKLKTGQLVEYAEVSVS